jgi:hypothetical protein
VADVNEVERALADAIEKRMLEGAGKLSGVKTVDGVVQVTFLGVTDDAHVFDTLSGALLDLRILLEVQPDLDVKSGANSACPLMVRRAALGPSWGEETGSPRWPRCSIFTAVGRCPFALRFPSPKSRLGRHLGLNDKASGFC